MEALINPVTNVQPLQIKDINCDEKYQRVLNYAKCKRIKEHFNPNLVGVLLVAKRENGEYVILDGHHRLVALQMLGKRTALCQVITGLTYEEEADLFGKYNTQRTCVNSTDLFKARIEARYQDALDITKITKKAGYICGNIGSRKRNTVRISAVRALESSYTKLHSDGLYTMLDTIGSTWIKNKDAVGASMLNGATTFFSLYGDRVKKETFVKALSDTTPQNIVTKARLSGEGNLRYPIAKVMWDAYNKCCRGDNRLPYLF